MNKRYIIAFTAVLTSIASAVYFHCHQNQLKAAPTPPAFQSGHSEGGLTTSVYVYFGDPNLESLVSEKRDITEFDDPTEKAKTIIELLIKGPRENLVQTLPPTTALREVYLTPKGLAVVDFTETLSTDHPGSAQMELMTLYAIVNSLILNIDQINAVQFLINGRESTTLAGHIDIRFPFKANMLLVK